MKKYFIPWLKKKLSKRGKMCIVSHFPSFKFQSYKNWERSFRYRLLS